jgi:hypothetical protein
MKKYFSPIYISQIDKRYPFYDYNGFPKYQGEVDKSKKHFVTNKVRLQSDPDYYNGISLYRTGIKLYNLQLLKNKIVDHAGYYVYNIGFVNKDRITQLD